MEYAVVGELTIPALANPRYADLALNELDGRVIGGDKGDLSFRGYTVEEKHSLTVLYRPILHTSLVLSPEEVFEIAQEILMYSYDSIGVETVEHN